MTGPSRDKLTSSGPRASGSLMTLSEPEARGPDEHESIGQGFTSPVRQAALSKSLFAFAESGVARSGALDTG